MHPRPDDHPEAETQELADGLADWLEELKLVGTLEEAGLPRLTRGAAGRARWTDPETGDVLTGEQLRGLEAMLRRQGAEPEHAVPVPLLQIARQARVRQHLLSTSWFTYATLAGVRGTTLDATRFAVHKAGGEHRLLVVAGDDGVVIPAFQLDEAGEVRPDLVAVMEPLLVAGMDPWRTWGWLTQPAALLGGQVPHEVAADPAERDFVVDAAIRLAERVTLSSRA